MNFPKHYFRYLILDQYYRMLPDNVNAAEATRNIQKIYGKGSISESDCKKWFKCFKEGDYSLEDRPRSGRPPILDDSELDAVRKAGTDQTQSEMAEQVGTSQQTVSRHLKAMGVRHVYGREVPHELTELDKGNRLSIATSLLSRFNRKKLFLSRIITGDESWVFYANFKRKRQYLAPGEKRKANVRPDPHRKKNHAVLLLGNGGPRPFRAARWKEDTQQYRILPATRCGRQEVIKKRGPDKKVCFQRDNAKPHVANLTQAKLKEFGWEVLAHPAYSPDLAPSDYGLFISLKDRIAEIHFENEGHLENWLKNEFFAKHEKKFYKRLIKQLPLRWAKVVEYDGDYFDSSEFDVWENKFIWMSPRIYE